MEIMMLKNKITEMKNSLKGPNGTFELEEARISKLEERTVEIMQSKQQRGKKNEEK